MRQTEVSIASINAGRRLHVAEMRSRDARGRRTMKALHEALLELIEEGPFERITTDDIVRRAGVGRTTFYRHYAHKEALMEEIARREVAHIVGLALPVSDKRDSLPNCRRLVTHVGSNRKLWSVLLTGGAAGVMRQKFVELTTPVDDGHEEQVEHGVPVDLAASWGVAATVEILAWWLRNPDRADVEEVAGYVDRLAVRPSLDAPRAKQKRGSKNLS